MVTLSPTAYPISDNTELHDALKLFVSGPLDQPLAMNDETAKAMATVLAAQYGPALKELEKH